MERKGDFLYNRRTRGSERRGVFPVPDISRVHSREQQSRADKAKLLELIRERELARRNEQADKLAQELGNKELPIYRHKQEVLASIESYKATILGGETGSGKSTQLPQYLLESGYDKIFVLVPRRVIADGLGERIRDELVMQQGDDAAELVGIVHGERRDIHESDRITVMTPNTFNRMAMSLQTEYADKRVAIISDEIHEANLYSEIATGVAAQSVQAYPDWRLIAASATLNTEALKPSFEQLNGGYVPVITVEGRPFQVELKESEQETSMEAYARVGSEHQKAMIFTSGKKEIDHIINETTRVLTQRGIDVDQRIVFRKLHAELTEVELSHINDPVPEGRRLVIVSSPAGMSGITIPGVTLVVTDGTINRQELDEDGTPGLTRRYLSQAEVTQQIGRAGRDVPGGVGILARPTSIIDDSLRRRGVAVDEPAMPFVPFQEREPHAPPEIYHTNLSRVVLGVAALDRRFSDINAYIPHSVSASAIINAEETLSRLGALDADDGVTEVGRRMDRFPISPELSRGLIEAFGPHRTLQHMARAAFIVAAIESGGLQDFDSPHLAQARQLIRPETSDDFIAQLDLMTQLQLLSEADTVAQRDFLDSYGLHEKRVETARKLARKILGTVRIHPDNTVVSVPTSDEESLLRRDLTAGMIDQVYVRTAPIRKSPAYVNIHGNQDSTRRVLSRRSIATGQAPYLAGFPRWYETIDKKSKQRIRHNIIELTMEVDPDVVGEYATQNRLLIGKLVGSRVKDGEVVELEQATFGTIEVGEPDISLTRVHVPESSRRQLVEYALKKPGPAQLALRALADELAWYHQSIPSDELLQYKKGTTPAELTKEGIRELIDIESRGLRRADQLDDRLAQYIYSRNLTINRYYDEQARQELQKRSPQECVIGHTLTSLHYDAGVPYVTRLTPSQVRTVKAVGSPVLLPDGREILLQRAKPEGGVERISMARLEG